MTRALAIAIAFAPALASAAPVLPGGAQVSIGRLFAHENGSAMLAPATTVEHDFNLAHCACSQAGAAPDTFVDKTVAWELLLVPGTMAVHRPLDIWVGPRCDDPAMRAAGCHRIASATIADLSTLPTVPTGATPEVPIYDVIVPEPGGLGCTPRAQVASEWVLVDSTGGGSYDYATSVSIAADTLAPPLPTGFAAAPERTSITIQFTPPADTSDIVAYQALCADDVGAAVATGTRPAPRYQTARQLCGEPLDVPLVPSLIDTGVPLHGVDAAVGVALPQTIAQLDPSLVCGEAADPNASSIQLVGLPPHGSFVVALLAIDRAGNAAATYFQTHLVTHDPTDLWTDLHDRGSRVEGGFCLVADTYGDDHPLTRGLRAFRDATLARTAVGRALVAAYYASIGKLGALVRGRPLVRVVVALALAPLVAIALAWHALSLPGLLVVVALVVLARRRYRNRHAAWPSTTSPSTVPVGVGRQPRATRSSSSSSALGRWSHTETAPIAPSHVVSKQR